MSLPVDTLVEIFKFTRPTSPDHFSFSNPPTSAPTKRHHNYPRPVDVIGSERYPYKYQIKYQLYQRDLFRFARVA
ncbi:hypothetical protein BT69DRAFT_1344939, partial [Atractiella rhizophila]